MKANLSDKRVVLLLAMVCCFLWGSATPAIKIGYQVFRIDGGDTQSIILFAGIRFLTAGLLVVLFQSLLQKRFLRPQREALPSIFALSMAQTVVQYLFFYVGLAHTSGVHGTIISGTGGFFSILMASLLFHYEKLTPAKVLGCVAGFGGILVMNLSGMAGESLFQVSLLGEGFVLFSQLSYALSGILLKYNPVSRVAIFTFLTPLFGVLLSAIFLGEAEQALSLRTLAALVLVCAGICAVNRQQKTAD